MKLCLFAIAGLAIGFVVPAIAQEKTGTCTGPQEACLQIVSLIKSYDEAFNRKDTLRESGRLDFGYLPVHTPERRQTQQLRKTAQPTRKNPAISQTTSYAPSGWRDIITFHAEPNHPPLA
jgi:hypothetical protein